MSKSTGRRKKDPNFRPKPNKKPAASWAQVLTALTALWVALLLAYWTKGDGGLIRVSIAEDGDVGIEFGEPYETNDGSYLPVTGIRPGSQAAKQPQIEVGLLLHSVAHQPVVNKPKQAVEHLLAKHRPLSLTFARPVARKEATAGDRLPGIGRERKQHQTVRPADWDEVEAAKEFKMEDLLAQIVDEVDGARYVSHDPPIVTIDEFLTDEECASIIEIGTPGLEPSTGTGQYKNGKFERLRMASRTSHNSWLMNGLEHHPTVATLDRRIANVTGLFEGNSEHYQVLRYQPPDQFYKSHSDFIVSQVEQDCGPRLFTFFLYLADVKDGMGGETFFPNAQSLADPQRPPCTGLNHHVTFSDEVDCGLLVKPRKRSAVLWPNVDMENFGRQNPKTNHAALAIKEDCGVDDAEHCFKWAANVWIHAFDFKGAHGKGRTG